MTNMFYPGGHPYTPPHELTEEELEEIFRFLEELKKKSEEEEDIEKKHGKWNWKEEQNELDDCD